MSRPASMVVTQTAIFWGHDDSHERVIADNNIHMDGAGGPNGVRVEIVPPEDGNMSSPAKEWVYHLDGHTLEAQDKLPSWYDSATVEARVRKELPMWIKARVVRNGQMRNVLAGECVYNHGTVEFNHGTVKANYGTVKDNYGTVEANYGTVENRSTGATCTNSSQSGVIIDRTGTVPTCIIGEQAYPNRRE